LFDSCQSAPTPCRGIVSFMASTVGVRAGDATDLWLGRVAPRYTSYPPASAFGPNVTETEFRHSLTALPVEQPVSIYVHIPFCHALCLYCACNMAVTHRPERMDAYLRALQREIETVSGIGGKRRVTHLHIGGGTPNTLPWQCIDILFEWLRAVFNVDAATTIRIELDPSILTEGQIRCFKDNGVSRVSLGIQDFDATVQLHINRIQPFEMIALTCERLRSAGITDINFDLMYGLPGQSLETVASTCRQASLLSPDRIAFFGYAHVPRMKKYQRRLERFGLPGAYDRRLMERRAREVLVTAGYAEIGMDHYCRPGNPLELALRAGRLHRSFQGYTDDPSPTLIAIGASAISRTDDGYFQDSHGEHAYVALASQRRIPTSRGHLLSLQDRLRGTIIEHLMCYFESDLDSICASYGVSPTVFGPELEALREFEEAGLVLRSGNRIEFLGQDRPAIRTICSLFDLYYAGQEHSSSQVA
ncbi:MAG: oxygen-independent coproporphyrinogen III oxidase, partial [Alphaproteobacteria bacterium]